MDVIATIKKFRSEDRRTEQRIDYGVWLDSSCASTDFEAGDTRELLLVIDATTNLCGRSKIKEQTSITLNNSTTCERRLSPTCWIPSKLS